MIFKRDLTKVLSRFTKFPVIALLGPRQSGKTTLVKNFFSKHQFITFEDPAIRSFAENDPVGFLRQYDNEYGMIIDEFQYVPTLLSYIQTDVDTRDRPGYFILTGSENFLMNQTITQSLAGRVGILNLLPLSINELKENKLIHEIDTAIFQGGYPRLYKESISALDFYPSYIQSYIERYVRQLVNISQLSVFHKFMQLCAGRVGQLLNISDIAVNCGVDQKIIRKWLSVLEASYVIFLLPPHFKNFNKRVTKTPKLFFYDTGIACSLLGLRSSKNVSLSPFRGHLFENYIIADFYKQYYNQGLRPPLYFWRDQNGRVEVDCIIDIGNKLIPVEIKSGETIVNNFFDSLIEWNNITNEDRLENYIVYGGQSKQARNKGTVIGWKASGNLIKKIETS